jgi:predicted RNase H-like HicB family nuclease
MRYTIVISEKEDRYYACVPDVPDVVATGKTIEDVKKQIKDTLEFHFEHLLESGRSIPKSNTICSHVEVNTPTVHMSIRT